MKPRLFPFRHSSGLTAIDVLVLIGTVALAFVVMSSATTSNRGRSHTRTRCVSNLKQLGLASRMWSNDNGDKFPWNVTNLTKGILEPFAYCRMMSNELNSPKILVCPEDLGRSRATAFDQTFSNNNLSYFLGLDADETNPNSLLSGDRNLSTNTTILSGLVTLQNSKQVNWAPGIHEERGNVGLADGSAQQVSTKSIRSMMDDRKIVIPARLLIP